MSDIKLPWCEKYRPKDLNSIILQPSLKKKMEQIINEGTAQLSNFTFSGSAGTGKTTLALMIVERLELPYLFINGSDETGIDVIRSKVRQFCTTMAIDGKMKVVIIDEADRLSGPAQDSMKGLIEEVAKTTRFIFTCNHPERMIDPVKSRTKEIYFAPVDLALFGKRIYEILKAEKVEIPANQKQNLLTLIKSQYPDFRKTLNYVEFCSTSGTLEIDFDEIQSEDVFLNVVQLIKAKKLSEIREIFRNNKLDYTGLIRKIFDAVLDSKNESFKELKEDQRAEMIVLCAEYIHRSLNFIIDREVNCADFLVQSMGIVGRK